MDEHPVVQEGPIDEAPRVRMRRRPAASVLVLVAFLNGALLLLHPAVAPRSERTAASAAVPLGPPLRAGAVEAVDALVAGGVERELFPGATYAVGRGARIERVAGVGRTAWRDEEAAPVAPAETRYDLASLTMVVATTAAVMALVEDGRMELDAPVSRYLPQFTGEGKERVTVRMLLTHTSGVRAGAALEGETAAAVRRWLIGRPLTLKPGEEVLYSDVGFVVLYAAAERAAGQPLPRYLRRRVWAPLGMRSTELGVERGCGDCAPTLRLEDGEPYAGGSYDETARRMDGVAGNAGLFSTAADLARFAAMIAAGGTLDGVRVFRPETVRLFTRPQPGAGTRALGWEVYCREGKVKDYETCEDPYAFGHTGVTGTSLWIDPQGGAWVVLLTNRVFEPKVKLDDFDMQSLRRLLFDTASGRRSERLAEE